MIKKIVNILLLISFSIFISACSQKSVENNSNQFNTSSTEVKQSDSSSSIVEEEHLKISFDNKSEFTIENISDLNIYVIDSNIEVFQLVNNEWVIVEFWGFLDFARTYIVPSVSTEYILPEQLKDEGDYKLIVPYKLSPFDSGTLKQTYYFSVKEENYDSSI